MRTSVPLGNPTKYLELISFGLKAYPGGVESYGNWDKVLLFGQYAVYNLSLNHTFAKLFVH